MTDRTVCVDLNGTLDTYSGWRGDDYWYPPRRGARAFLATLNVRGYRVVVFTTRDVAGVWAWLRRFGLAEHVYDVTNVKIPARVYVDDRALTFRGKYPETLKAIEEFHPHWEVKSTGGHDSRPAGSQPSGSPTESDRSVERSAE